MPSFRQNIDHHPEFIALFGEAQLPLVACLDSLKIDSCDNRYESSLFDAVGS